MKHIKQTRKNKKRADSGELVWMQRSSPSIGSERCLVKPTSVGTMERRGWSKVPEQVSA